MTNNEVLRNAKYQLSLLIKIIDEAAQLSEDEIENLSLSGIRVQLDKEQYGLTEQIYDLELQLHRARKAAK